MLKKQGSDQSVSSVLKLSALSLVLASSALANPHANAGKKDTRTQLARNAKADAPHRIAVSYLKALAGQGDTDNLDLLLGGVTMTAEDFTIPNWRIAKREPVRKEVGDLAAVKREIRNVRSAGTDALEGMLDMADDAGEDTITKVDQEQADEMMAPTRARAARFQQKFPVMAYLARADKEVFWHPSNPFLASVEDMGDSGRYRAEVHLFLVKEKRGNKTRTWPLRVMRLQADGYDSGYKVLPASNWDPEY